jgi:hypothetical protein
MWRAGLHANRIAPSHFFLIREVYLALMLSHLSNDLLRVVRTRPLVSVANGGDRYSLGYSALDLPSLADAT